MRDAKGSGEEKEEEEGPRLGKRKEATFCNHGTTEGFRVLWVPAAGSCLDQQGEAGGAGSIR